MNPYALLGIAVLAEVLGTSALRASEGFSRWQPGLLVVLSYATAFYLMSLALKSIPLGVSYAIWSGMGTALTALVGWLYFRDAFNWVALGGIALIIAGVAVLNASGGRH